jgi:5-methylcytosine-specific restriction endonuclease McrA
MKKGQKHTDEAKRKNSFAHVGRCWSEERKRAFGDLIRSKIRTPEHNRHIAEGQLGNKRGTSWNKGKIFPEAQGSNHVSWIGGDRRYWKRIVMERDSYTCWECGFSDEEIMEVHHIKPVCLSPELARDPANMITLCPNCHRRKTLRDKKLISKNRMLKYKVTHGMNIFYTEMMASL